MSVEIYARKHRGRLGQHIATYSSGPVCPNALFFAEAYGLIGLEAYTLKLGNEKRNRYGGGPLTLPVFGMQTTIAK